MKVAVASILVAAAVLAVPAASLGKMAPSPGGQVVPGVRLDDRAGDRLVVTTPAYRLTLSKRNGALLDLVDRESGNRLLEGSNGCLWGATAGDASYVGGCAFSPEGPSRFSYTWDRSSSTLTLAYEGDPAAPRPVRATVSLTAGETSFDLKLALENGRQHPLEQVVFPADLVFGTSAVAAGYAPSFLPGVRLRPGFFSRVGNDVLTYPSRWAFADYLALDLAGSHLALYSVNPAPDPIAPVNLGFIHNAAPVPCSGTTFCLTHAFQTWVADGETWTSPVVRVRVGEPAEQTILDYRHDNGIDAYPSVSDKLGVRLDSLARAPLIKADLWKGLPLFRDWGSGLRRLPSPALVHPVAFQPGGHDESDPDFLPPDPRWGTADDFRAAIREAHSLGQLVMPYLNVSWWDDGSPTVRGLPAPLTLTDIAVQNRAGTPVAEQYGEHNGYLVSPYVPFVRERVGRLLEQWRTDVPVDCLFFDQIGARPWRRDFNPAAPSPLAYDDGWLSLMAPYADRCLMVEDGWDRLARSFVGFHGGLLLMQREFAWADEYWGAGNWEAFPLALWLLHDKVLMYQHDLYEGTMTADAEVLTWNLAFGFMLSYNWDESEATLPSPWLAIVGAFQRALGPRYVGVPLTRFEDLAPGVTRTVFGDYSVLANWSASATYDVDGYGIAPRGFLARTKAGDVVAGSFAGSFYGVPLSAGTHYLIVERDTTGVTVRQPLGAETTVAVDPPSSWRAGEKLNVVALGGDGQPLGDVGGEVRDGRLQFRYAETVNGGRAVAYRISAG